MPATQQQRFFEDLTVGMTETLRKTIDSSDVVGFAEVTGDRNPIHLSEHISPRKRRLAPASRDVHGARPGQPRTKNR